MTWELTIHTGNEEPDDQSDDEPIGSHDFTIFYNGEQVAFEPQEPTDEITWGEVRSAVALLNKLADPASMN